MCGISGYLRFPVTDVEVARRMGDSLSHRGPDGEGTFVEGPIALAHRRLAIIDVEGGAQPIYNEDQTVVVVLNGEIYNYRELAAELRQRHTFRTSSDTEVLVHLYEDFGEEMLGKLRGMFAFAIWDSRKQTLLVARDRFGEKPLLYVTDANSMWFASEFAALRAGGAPLGEIDRDALSDYLELLYIPAPRTIWSNARKLPAGHLLTADRDGVRIRRYWSPPTTGRLAEPSAKLVSDVRDCLEESVRLRLRSDVPVAVLLSGGIDSSAIVALAARELGRSLSTFSIGFGRDDDELPFARMVAEKYGTNHIESTITDSVEQATSRAFDAYTEPFGDSSAVPTVEVFRLVGQQVKVVLTGDGGDELFAGYGRYRQVARLPRVPGAAALAQAVGTRQWTAPLTRLARAARVLGARGGARYRALIEVFSPAERRDLLGAAAGTASWPEAPTDVDSALAFDLAVYLPDDLLVKTDIASMHWGVEARCPLLDHELAERVVPLTARYKQNRRIGKLLLRSAIGDLLPPAILERKKRGFGSPVGSWLSGPLRSMFSDLVASRRSRLRDWLDPAAVDRCARAIFDGTGNPHQGWALLSLAAWAARFERPHTKTGDAAETAVWSQ